MYLKVPQIVAVHNVKVNTMFVVVEKNVLYQLIVNLFLLKIFFK